MLDGKPSICQKKKKKTVNLLVLFKAESISLIWHRPRHLHSNNTNLRGAKQQQYRPRNSCAYVKRGISSPSAGKKGYWLFKRSEENILNCKQATYSLKKKLKKTTKQMRFYKWTANAPQTRRKEKPSASEFPASVHCLKLGTKAPRPRSLPASMQHRQYQSMTEDT